MLIDKASRTRMAIPPIWAICGNDRAVADHIAAVLRRDRPVHIAVAGGRTPEPILADLAARPLPWERVTVLPTDERLVSCIGRASNYGMIRDRLAPCSARVLRLAVEETPARFDLVWLGMGLDGKVASLFVADDCTDLPSRAVKIVRPRPLPRNAPYDRLTLPLGALVSTAQIILVVRGDAKRRLIERALRGDASLPLTHIFAHSASPVWIFWN